MIITIDGPSGTGKTTVARTLAQKLGFGCFDTGAMYRTFTLYVLREHVDIQDQEALERLIQNFDYSIDGRKVFLFQENVSEEIRSQEVTQKVSEIAALPQVRKKMVEFQKRFAAQSNAVFEGRDMGTVVFPNADLKIFLTASSEERAKRRFLELQEKGSTLSSEEVLTAIEKRDAIDSSREHSPLKKADDAIEIDTSILSAEEVISKIEELWNQVKS